MLLSDAQRSSLIDQLSAMQQREDPGCHVCFCGSTGELVEAVSEMRARLADEGATEELEL